MKKVYSSENDFQRKLEKSLKLMTDNVLATFGPYGKNVLITKDGNTFATKDGVTVAKSIDSEDETENAILNIIKQTADKTVQDAGDGTTFSILQINEFCKMILSTFKAFPDKPQSEIKEEIESQLKTICRALEKISTPIKSKQMLKDVAYMASNGDNQIASIVSDLIDEVGSNGSISIKSSKSKETHMKIMEGMRFKSVIASNVFLNDLEEKKVMNNCRVLVSNTKICLNDMFMTFIENCIIKKNSILIVCPEIEEKALLLLVGNYNRKLFDCAVIMPQYLGNEKLDVFEDIALITGTKVIATSMLPTAETEVYGFCASTDIYKYETCMVDAAADPAFIDKSIEALRGKLQATEDDAAIKRLNSRINRLSSTLGVLYVGGSTEAEITEKKHRVEDAIESCHSALRKGVVPGGGNALAYLADIRFIFSSVEELKMNFREDEYLKRYIKCKLMNLCRVPSTTLYKTDNKMYTQYPPSDMDMNEGKIHQVKDLRTNQLVDPIEKGIVEAVWTIQAGLMNAFSAAFILCNTYGSISESYN